MFLCCAQIFIRCASTMKGGGRGKELPVAGEITGKRPKRKCLQWHPLLSKKAMDFSEEEEEEDEEDLDKVSEFDDLTSYLFTSVYEVNNGCFTHI